MKKPLNSRAIRISFGVSMSILAWISIASYWSTHDLVLSFDTVAQGHKAIGKFQHIETLMELAESGVNDYVMTGNPKRLDPFHYARLMIPFELRQLDELLPVDSERRNSYESLTRILPSHLDYLERVVSLRKSGGPGAAVRYIVNQPDSKRDAMEHLLSDVQMAEFTALEDRWQRASEHSLRTKAFLALATLVSLALLGWIYGLLRKEAAGRWKAESAKGQTETFMRSIIERIPFMILVKEAENLRIRVANKAAAEWLGRSEEDLIDCNELDLRPKADAKASAQSDRQALGEGTLIDLEERLILPGKEERILHTQKIPVPDAEGNPSYLLTISEDITRRRQAERMLELSRDAAVEAASLRSDFIRNMSHEFRTPLSIVVGMSSLLADTSLSKDQRKFVETIRRAAHGLSVLTKSILDFSKIEAGSFSLENREVRVRPIVDDVVAMMNEQANMKGVNLVKLISHDIPAEIQGDPARLRQVLTQLVGNAVKFTEKGEVTVRAALTKQNESQVWITWRVTDTGIGISEAAQRFLFDPFRQADGSRTRRYGGTGLGLAVSKRIVELMGGQISFESTPGRGSAFWFTLPFNKRHVRGPAVQVATLPWTRARVMVACENDTGRHHLQQLLKDYALASEAASSGQTALEVLRRESKAGRAIPIVLIDMQLADMDGVTFAKAVRSDKSLTSTKVIVMIGAQETMDAETLATLGFAAQLRVPPEPQELYERLASAIDPHEPTSHQHAA